MGPVLLQQYYDIGKYLNKTEILSEHSSWITRVTPYLVFGCMAAAAMMLPLVGLSPLRSADDIILLIYIFGLARVFTVLGGLDAGSAFGGMGSSREMMVSMLVEPGLLLVLFASALRAGSTGLSGIVTHLSNGGISTITPSHLMCAFALFVLIIAETGRLPVDNPDTHLELTMIHEGMLLEYSGRLLGLMLWATSIKQLLFISLFVNLFLPWGIATTADISSLLVGGLVYILKIGLVAVGLGVVEMLTPKMRLFRLPQFMLTPFLVAFLGIISDYVVR